MKKCFFILITLGIFIFNKTLFAQNVAITDSTGYNAHNSAMLDVYSFSKGLLIPRTDTANVSNPAKGLLVCDTSNSEVIFYFYDGSRWIDIATSGGGTDSIWVENLTDSIVYLRNAYNKLGIGIDTPLAKLDVMGDTIFNAEDTVPLFVVRDKDGHEVFVVYPKGVFIYVDTLSSSTKATTNDQPTGFRVGKKTIGSTKDFDEEYFSVLPATVADTIDPSEARVLWYPKKEAFMAGRVLVEGVDSVGTNSWASGYESKSIGNYSQALGYQAIARGHYSTAIGYDAVADGDYSFALGDSTWAGGGGGAKGTADNCYAFGKKAEATGNGSYAFGELSLASGENSYAIGERDSALGLNSYSFGKGSYASNSGSVAFGYLAKSTGEDAFAFGTGTEATGKGSFAIGFIGRDSADVTTANTKATGNYAVAIGNGAQALYRGGCAMGTASLANANYSLALGYKATTSGWYAIALGNQTVASGANSIAIGAIANASGSSATAIGNTTTASGNNSLATGVSTLASGVTSTAMGTSSTASGNFSLATGNTTTASGQSSTALGAYTNASGTNSTATGAYSKASGNTSTAIGSNTFATGNASFSTGYYTKSTGFASSAMGAYTEANSAYETVIGQYNLAYTPIDTINWHLADRLFIIGNGTGSGSRSNAMTVLKNGNTGLKTSNPTSALHLGGSMAAPIITTSDDITLNDTHYTVICQSSQNRTVNLPQASTCSGRVYIIKKAAAGNVVIDPYASETIEGSATYTISVANQSVIIQCNGTAWYKIN